VGVGLTSLLLNLQKIPSYSGNGQSPVPQPGAENVEIDRKLADTDKTLNLAIRNMEDGSKLGNKTVTSLYATTGCAALGLQTSLQKLVNTGQIAANDSRFLVIGEKTTKLRGLVRNVMPCSL
jgi:hypothetical protein